MNHTKDSFKIMMVLKSQISNLKNSKLAIDSFWAIFGNGFGSALLLCAGVFIARLLGSDLYGEYGVVKSTMFSIGAFASCGLSITATKYVAEAVSNDSRYILSTIKDCLKISLCSSTILSLILIFCAKPLCTWLNSEALITPFRFLGIIIICRAVNMTQRGILGGLKKYNIAAKNAVISGFSMLILSIPLTIFFNLIGALCSLAISEICNCLLNYISICKHVRYKDNIGAPNSLKDLLKFSIPVALQESTNFICQWGGVLLLTKLSSMQEVGLYSASAQWNAILMFIPAVLYNVVISHLSSFSNNSNSQINIMKKMLAINIISTFVPFVFIWCFADWIASFYGASFKGMGNILSVLTCSTIFLSCANIFRSYFVTLGKNWLLLLIRGIRDAIFLISVGILLKYHNGINGGLYYAWSNLITSILFCIILYLFLVKYLKTKRSSNM